MHPVKIWPIRAENPLRWWAQTLAMAAAAVWWVLVGITSLFDHHAGPVGHALSIALGTVDPFEAHGADVPAVMLAVTSWLLVPAIIGVAAALVVDALLLQARPLTMTEVEQRVRDRQQAELAHRAKVAPPSQEGDH